MDLLLILFVLICVFLGWYYTKYRELLAKAAKLPGPPGLPIVGNFSMFMGKSPQEQLKLIESITAEYPKIVCLMLGPIPEILITDPKYAEIFLSSQKLIDKSDEYDLLHDWIASGLLTSTGKKWFSRRKVITPAFHFKILDQFVEIFDKHSNTLIKKLAESNGKPTDVFQPVALCALDIICESAMGIDIQAQVKSDSEYVQAVKEITVMIFKRVFTSYLRIDFIFNLTPYKKRYDQLIKRLHDFTDNVIINRRAELIKSNSNSEADNTENEEIGAKKKLAFLDVLLNATIEGKALTNLDIREEVDTFMFEGHDTTSSGISFCLYNLATDPKVQQKAYEEVMNVLGNKKSSITLLNNLNYLEMVIKESLRMFPSVPLFGRKIYEDVRVGDHILPKGSNIGLTPYLMGRSANLWEDPLKFDPERFSSDKQLSHPYLYTPFSAGPRNCIGQKFAMYEMKSTIAKVIKNFELSVVPGFEPVIVSELILRSTNGIWLQVKKRN